MKYILFTMLFILFTGCSSNNRILTNKQPITTHAVKQLDSPKKTMAIEKTIIPKRMIPQKNIITREKLSIKKSVAKKRVTTTVVRKKIIPINNPLKPMSSKQKQAFLNTCFVMNSTKLGVKKTPKRALLCKKKHGMIQAKYIKKNITTGNYKKMIAFCGKQPNKAACYQQLNEQYWDRIINFMKTR